LFCIITFLFSFDCKISGHKTVKANDRTGESIACTICTTVGMQVEKWIAENATEQEIIDRLQTFCNALGPVAPECQSLVAQYLPQLIEWIENKESPVVFCTTVGLCTSVEETRKQKRKEEQTTCEICQIIVTYVEELVAQNATVQEIIAKVEEFCNLLPAPGSSICDQLAASYIPQLVQWIINKENPQAFCAQFSLC